MQGRIIGTAAIVIAITAAACGDSTGPSGPVGSYHLVAIGNISPPIAWPAREEGPGVTCVDSLYDHVIRLRSGGRTAFETEQRTYCTGRAPRSSGGTIDGSWTARGDSVRILLPVASPSGPVNVEMNGSLEGGDLVFRERVYTEVDPDGSSGLFYERRYRRD